MSKGKEKVIEIEDSEPDLFPRPLPDPISDPLVPLESTSQPVVRNRARRMTPEVTTSSGSGDDQESPGAEETLSERSPGGESGDASSPEMMRPGKKRKLKGRNLIDNYAIDLMTCTTTVDDLEKARTMYGIPGGIDLRVPGKKDTPSRPPRGYVTLLLESFKLGMRLPLQPYFVEMLGRLRLAPGQLNPNGWRVLSGLFVLWDRCGLSEPTVEEVKHLYQLKSSPKDAGWYYFMSSTKTRKPVTDLPTGGGNWKSKFFFAGGPWGQMVSADGGNIYVPSRFSVPGCLLA